MTKSRRHGVSLRALCATVLGLGAMAVCTSASAYVDWSLNGYAGYDTNPGRSEHDAQGSATLFGGGTVTIDESRPRLDAKVGANLGYLDYLEHGFRGQINGAASADLRYALVPETLYWSLSDRFGQGTANVLAPATPDNRIQVNTFLTGPTLILPLNSVTRFKADARFGLDTYSGNALPNDARYTGSLALIRQLSPASDVSLNGDYLKVNYRSYSGNPGTLLPGELTPAQYASLGDYDRESLFVRYETRNPRTRWNIDVGAAKVNQSGQTFNSPLVRVAWDHKVSARWSVNLSGSHEYTDGAEAFGNAIDHSGIPLPNVPPSNTFNSTQSLPLTNQPMRTDSGRAGLAYNTTRTLFSGGVTVARDHYLLVGTSDDNRTGGDASITRRLTPYSDLHLGASYLDRRFPTLGQGDKTTDLSALYNWQVDPSVSVYAGYDYEKRTSTASYSYVDNRIVLGVRYTPSHHASQKPVESKTFH